ncbi:MAG: GvpL/GvpF family gas vesicle protein, partial [Dehalococcoidia bacterium]|nr:GvpL/GvpF family gas vesicle protein [Dehalococcoidia bacterium]
MAEQGQYIYCIIGTGDSRNFGPIGIGGRGDPVTTIAYRDLAAVVSSVSMARYEVGKDTMVAHEKVIETVMKDHALLPVRFYTVAPNAEEIRNLLRTRYIEFQKLLRELDNKVELGLKAIWKDMNAVFSELARENEKIKAAATTVDKDALSKIIKSALEEKKIGEREALLGPLRRISVDFRLNMAYGDDMIMNAAFLVDRAREMEFDSEVERLAS